LPKLLLNDCFNPHVVPESNFQGKFSNVCVEMFNENLVDLYFSPQRLIGEDYFDPQWCTVYYAVEVKKLLNHNLFYE
jgi:hypothetical protein